MKKAKIMLTATALLAIVGGAMAYSVQSRITVSYCTTSSGTSCNSFVNGHTGDASTTVSYATTTVGNCTTPPTCTTLGIIVSGD